MVQSLVRFIKRITEQIQGHCSLSEQEAEHGMTDFFVPFYCIYCKVGTALVGANFSTKLRGMGEFVVQEVA